MRKVYFFLCCFSSLSAQSITVEGDWTLSGDNSAFTGAVSVISNTLTVVDGTGIGSNTGSFAIGDGATSGTLQILNTGTPFATARTTTLTNTATMQVDTGTATFNGEILGDGSIVKTGTGRLSVTANNSYAGGTTVNAGIFRLDGTTSQIPSPVTVGASGTFTGTGRVDAQPGLATFTNNGTIFPGAEDATGTLTFDGVAFTQASGSTLEIEVNAIGDSDLLAITNGGTATIAGNTTISLVIDPGEFPALTPFTIMTVDGDGTGEFATVTTNLPAFTGQLVYSASSSLEESHLVGSPLDDPWHTLFLMLNVIDFADLVTGGNALAVARCLDTTPAPAGSDLAVIVEQLQFMTVAQMTASMNQMNSSLYNALDLAEEETIVNFREAITRRLADRQRRKCPDPNREALWSGFFYAQSHQHGRGVEEGFHTRTRAGIGGFDYRFSRYSFAGGCFGYARDDVRWEGMIAHSAVNSYAGGLYAGSRGMQLYTTAAVLGFYDDYEGQRSILFQGDILDPITRIAKHDGEGWGVLGHLEVGGILKKGTMEVHPFGKADYVFAHRSSFTETGAGSISLDVFGHNADVLRTETGLYVTKCNQWESDSVWFPHAKIAWVYEKRFYGQSSEASFTGSNCVMRVKGLDPIRSLVAYGGGLDVRGWDDHLFLGAEFDGEWSQKYWNYTFEAQVKISF